MINMTTKASLTENNYSDDKLSQNVLSGLRAHNRERVLMWHSEYKDWQVG